MIWVIRSTKIIETYFLENEKKPESNFDSGFLSLYGASSIPFKDNLYPPACQLLPANGAPLNLKLYLTTNLLELCQSSP